MNNLCYYTYPHYFDPAIHFVDQIKDDYNINLIIEVHPNNSRSAMFDVDISGLTPGIYDGKKLLNKLPKEIGNVFEKLENIYVLIVERSFVSINGTLLLNRVKKLISEIKPDIVHFDDVSPRSSLLIYLVRNYKLITNIHDAIQHTGEELFLYKLLRKFAYKHINHFLLFNKFSLKEFISKYSLNEDKVTSSKLGHYYFYKSFLKEIPRKNNYILFFGRLSHYKGVDIFISACKNIETRYPDLKFIIAGKEAYNFSLPQITDGRFIIINEYIPNERLAELIQNSLFVVLPYKDSSQSGALLTSLAFNKPTIVSNVGAFPEYIEDKKTGLMFDLNNSNDLVDKMSFMLDNRDAYECIQNTLVEKKDSWKDIVAKSKIIYNNIIK